MEMFSLLFNYRETGINNFEITVNKEFFTGT